MKEVFRDIMNNLLEDLDEKKNPKEYKQLENILKQSIEKAYKTLKQAMVPTDEAIEQWLRAWMPPFRRYTIWGMYKIPANTLRKDFWDTIGSSELKDWKEMKLPRNIENKLTQIRKLVDKNLWTG